MAPSTPSLAETTNSAQSAARSPARRSPTKSAYPGASSRLTLIAADHDGREGQADRALLADLGLVVVADRRAFLDTADPADRAGGVQQGLDERRLARPRWPHQHHVPDGVW